jgi:hypothetical protein
MGRLIEDLLECEADLVGARRFEVHAGERIEGCALRNIEAPLVLEPEEPTVLELGAFPALGTSDLIDGIVDQLHGVKLVKSDLGFSEIVANALDVIREASELWASTWSTNRGTTGGAGETTMTTAESTRKTEIGRNAERDWRGQEWSNATHASVTDPDARLYRKAKGKPAQLCYMGHALTENRNGFVVDMLNTHDPGSTRRLTLGADKGYDAAKFIDELRRMCVTPHIAAKAKGSSVDGRTTLRGEPAETQAHRGAVRVGKTVGPICKTMLRGLKRVCAQFTLTMAAYNLAKLPNLVAA